MRVTQNESTAFVFDIQRFSLHDGPGIRTLVFFKGCSLSCAWCSNPEGISFAPEIRNNRRLCAGCGVCVKNCPSGAISMGTDGVAIARDQCVKCGVCIKNCVPKALSLWGKEYTISELFDKARRDAPFYTGSNGGITLGGGDPLLQNEQAVELLKVCKENNINTAIETAGNYPWAYLENAAPFCDTIHFDVKGWNQDTCKRCIGSDNLDILRNLKKLDAWLTNREERPSLNVRIPLIPDFNFTPEDFQNAASFFAELKSITRIEILPFHNLGEAKYRQLERKYHFMGCKNLKEEAVEPYYSIFKQANLPVEVTSM